MDYRSVLKDDFDESLNFRKQTLHCYSRKELDNIYGDKEYHIVGEIFEKEAKDKVKSKGSVLVDTEKYKLYRERTRNRFFFKEAGYLYVGGDNYVALLKLRWPIVILSTAAAIGLIAGGIFLASNLLASDIPSVDPNVGAIENDTQEKPKPSAGGGGNVTLTYKLEANMSLSDGKVHMYFLNPGNSNHEVSVVLNLINGNDVIPIAESGRIPAGYGLEEMQFNNKANISVGNYNAEYIVYFYSPGGEEKANVDSKVTDVVLSVTK